MASLHTEQLDYLLAHLAQVTGKVDYLGVFSADCVPSVALLASRSRDACFVSNTDPLGKPGSHWLAFFYYASYRVLEYFDSYGLSLHAYNNVARNYYGRNLAVHQVNFATLQSFLSTACGYYCVLFLRLRTMYDAASSVQCINKLGESSRSRDSAVVKTVHKLMHANLCTALPSSSCFAAQSQSCCSLSSL